jgi:hypothetical protein
LIADSPTAGRLPIGDVHPKHRLVTVVHRLRRSRRTATTVLIAALAVVALTAPATAPAAEKNCAKAVVADWYGDGRVDQIFPLHCYRDAIKSLPVDVLDYSNAKEDILRALSFARKGKSDPGDAGTGGTGGGGGNGGGTDTTPGGGVGGTLPDITDGSDGTGDETLAGGGVDTSGPSSVPVPLLVLGGLALLLLAAGGAGYANRRLQARRATDADDDFTGPDA